MNSSAEFKPPSDEGEAAYYARAEFLQKQALELMNNLRWLHTRIILAMQGNELDPSLRKWMYDTLLMIAMFVEVKE